MPLIADVDAPPISDTLIVEGGAMRSVFSAGLLDSFLHKGFNPFDSYIGVSAGACNLVSYLSGDAGKNIELFTHVAGSRKFINLPRFLRGDHLLDMQWLFDEVVSREIDPHASCMEDKPLLIGMTEVATGKAAYRRANATNLLGLLKASMSLPVLYNSFPMVEGRAMVDGGLADAIPVQKAIELGAKRIMVVRSRHAGYVKRDSLFHRYIRWRLRKHPQLAATLKRRVDKHNEATALLRSPPAGVHIVDLCPPPDFRMGRFGQHLQQLMYGYRAGATASDHAMEAWEKLFH